MLIWIDSSGLDEAPQEARNYAREMLRELLAAGKEHDYRFLGWPQADLGSVETFLGPLEREVREVLSSPRKTVGPRRVIYSPIGFPGVDALRRASGPGASRPAAVATFLEERPLKLAGEATTLIALHRSAAEAISASASPTQMVRWVPPGLGLQLPLNLSNTRVPIPEGEYLVARGADATAGPETLAGIWRLLRAFRAYRRDGAGKARLLFLGGLPFALRQMAACLGLTRDVSCVPDDKLDELARVRLIASAAAVIHVSRPDTSWLLASEGLHLGVPVIAPRSEWAVGAWGDAALYYAEPSTLEISRAMTRLLLSNDLRRRLARKGLARCQTFTWANSARQLLDCLVQAAEPTRELEPPLRAPTPQAAPRVRLALG